MRLYPMALKIEGRRCVVIGGGTIAERKVDSLLVCKALVTVVSPECTPEIEGWAEQGLIGLERRPFVPGDVRGALLVIAATNIREVNEAVFEAGHAAGAIVNVVDVPDLCDYYVPATVTRGDLQIAISTGGACPAMSKDLRKKLGKQFGPEYEHYVRVGEWLRLALLGKVPDPELRKEALEQFLASDALALVALGDEAGARSIAESCLRKALGGGKHS